jgi:hypothetical protein
MDYIITIYDPSNNIIKPPLKRQTKFYRPKETNINDNPDMIGNNIDFQFINKELVNLQRHLIRVLAGVVS